MLVPPHLADYAHLAICANRADEAKRDDAVSRMRVIFGRWEEAPETDPWMAAPEGPCFSWVEVGDAPDPWEAASFGKPKRPAVVRAVPAKRRARPEQNLYNDHKAALRAYERQMNSNPDDMARVRFIRDEMARRKAAVDEYASELQAFCRRQKEKCAREGYRFCMTDYHDDFVSLTATVAARHKLRHLDTGALLFVQ